MVIESDTFCYRSECFYFYAFRIFSIICKKESPKFTSVLSYLIFNDFAFLNKINTVVCRLSRTTATWLKLIIVIFFFFPVIDFHRHTHLSEIETYLSDREVVAFDTEPLLDYLDFLLMADLLLPLFITFMFLSNTIGICLKKKEFLFLWKLEVFYSDTTVINGTAQLRIFERVPDRIIGMIAIANSSSEEIFWGAVRFEEGGQFPLKFVVVITNQKIASDFYTLQLQIYQVPRGKSDYPLWAGETTNYLVQSEKPNDVNFIVYRESNELKIVHQEWRIQLIDLDVPTNPCLIGVVYTTDTALLTRTQDQLNVVIGSLPLTSIPLSLDSLDSFIFLISNISSSVKTNSTPVYVSLKSKRSVQILETRKSVDLTDDSDCATVFFRLSTQSKNEKKQIK